MSRDNQIEEIVQDVDKAIRANFAWDVLAGGYIVSSADNIAQELYYKDYRKASDVAEDIFAEIDSIIGLICAMTGLDFIILGKYAELKKKYTEEGK